MDTQHNARNQEHYHSRRKKPRTNKILDRLTFSPKKHKQKHRRKLKEKLQQKPAPVTPTSPDPPSKLKLGSMNVNGLDIEASWAIEQLLTTRDFDEPTSGKIKITLIITQILALSETFSRSDQPSPVEPIDGYISWTSERGGMDKGGGGLNMLYKNTLTAHEWNPSVPPNLTYIKNERQWLLLDNKKQRCAFLHLYIACQNNKSDAFLQWNEDLFFLITQEAVRLKKQGFVIIGMGDFNSRVGNLPGLDFNTPDTNKNTPMFINFITEINLLIMNTLPITKGTFTRFMDSSV